MTRRFGAAAVLAAVALLSAEGGAAAKSSKYYHKIEYGPCALNACTMKFPKVPADKVLETTTLSCDAEGSTLGAPPRLANFASKGTLAFIPLVGYVPGNNFLSSGVFTGQVYIEGGEQPSVYIGGANDATCTLSGRLLND